MKHQNERLAAISRRLDPIWWLISRLCRLRAMSAAAAIPSSILLVELNLLGDMVMLVPLLRVIRRHHPGAHVALMAGPWGREVLAHTGLVDEFILLRAPWVKKGRAFSGTREVWGALRTARARTWDWGIDVRGDVRNALLLAMSRAQRRIGYDFTGGSSLLTDVVADDGRLRHMIDHHAVLARHLGMSMTAEERVPTLAGPAGGTGAPPVDSPARALRKVVGFHFGASMPLRKMPLNEAIDLVLSFEHREHTRLVLVEAPDTREMNAELLRRLPWAFAAVIERWSGTLAQFMSLLKTLDEFYAMDSGPAHLAAALGVNTTVFFGPHLAMAVRPTGSNVTVIERGDVPCRPCDQHRCINPDYQQCLSGTARIAVRAQSD